MIKKHIDHSTTPPSRIVSSLIDDSLSSDVTPSQPEKENRLLPRNEEKTNLKNPLESEHQDREACFRAAQQYITGQHEVYIRLCSVKLTATRAKLRRVATEIRETKKELRSFDANSFGDNPDVQSYLTSLKGLESTQALLYGTILESYKMQEQLVALKAPVALMIGVWLHMLKANCGKSEWAAFLHTVDLNARAAAKFSSLVTRRIKLRPDFGSTENMLKTLYEAALPDDPEQKKTFRNLCASIHWPQI